jgi:L-fucose isomerase-like protein
VAERIRVGLVSFTDPRSTHLATEYAQYEIEGHKQLAHHLRARGFDVVDPMEAAGTFRVRTSQDSQRCVSEFLGSGIEALILGCWRWTDPMLAIDIVRQVDRPTLLFAQSDPAWTGIGCIGAIGAGLWQIAPHRNALNHTRVLDDTAEVVRWLRGSGAYVKMRRKRLLLWGGSYALRMEHLTEDVSRLKSFLIGDILNEGQYLLIKRAEDILKREPHQIEKFASWLRSGGARITFDERMLTPEAFRKQIALYLAARQRLRELESEDIVGVSLRCQPELSEEYGVTGCLIPSFLPFSEDYDGSKQAIAATCEGDIKGLLTSVLLTMIEPDIPAGFGDIRSLKIDGRSLMMIGNCGGASVYYAANSSSAEEVLPNIAIRGQCQGASGGAVGYRGRPCEQVTVARLVRVAEQYRMQLALGSAVEVTEEMLEILNWGSMWPQLAIDIGVDVHTLVQRIGSNHFSVMPGDLTREIGYACRAAGICVERLDGQ